MVTDRVIAEMEKGLIPWNRPWHGVNDSAVSYNTGRPYSLLNQFLLGGRPGEYLTFEQCKKLGGYVKKGSKASFIVFYKSAVKTEIKMNDDGNEEMFQKYFPVLKSYNVFHIDDCEGIKSKLPEEPELFAGIEPDEAAEKIIASYLANNGPKFKAEKSNRAFYSPSLDSVTVPMLEQYDTNNEYYSTAFHELVHSTGHESRLNRKLNQYNPFGSTEYSKEELIAEMGAAMLCSVTGLGNGGTFKNSVAYLQGWVQKFKEDKKMIVWAASGAEKATRLILGEDMANKEE